MFHVHLLIVFGILSKAVSGEDQYPNNMFKAEADQEAFLTAVNDIRRPDILPLFKWDKQLEGKAEADLSSCEVFHNFKYRKSRTFTPTDNIAALVKQWSAMFSTGYNHLFGKESDLVGCASNDHCPGHTGHYVVCHFASGKKEIDLDPNNVAKDELAEFYAKNQTKKIVEAPKKIVEVPKKIVKVPKKIVKVPKKIVKVPKKIVKVHKNMFAKDDAQWGFINIANDYRKAMKLRPLKWDRDLERLAKKEINVCKEYSRMFWRSNNSFTPYDYTAGVAKQWYNKVKGPNGYKSMMYKGYTYVGCASNNMCAGHKDNYVVCIFG